MYQGFLAFKYGDLNRDRTCDPHPVKMVLSQLSYQIMFCFAATSNIIPSPESKVNKIFKKSLAKFTISLMHAPVSFEQS